MPSLISGRVDTIKDAVQIGRYMIRCPLVLKRLQWDEERGEVVYAARPSRAKGPFGGVVRWDALEFIARVTDHIMLSAALRSSPRNI